MPEERKIVELYLCRGGKFLILQRAGGRGTGWWGPPGGEVEAGEDPSAAAVRETMEETGLRIEHPELLRRWRWQHPADSYMRDIISYIAAAPDGDVRLSVEHTAYDWTTPSAYAERFCSERLADVAPDYAAMFRETRATCDIVARKMEAH